MRNGALIFLTVLMSLILGTSVEASHRAPRGWGKDRVVHHHVYRPRHHHVYEVEFTTDRYAYTAEPRGYYPYYNSGYWRPVAELRFRKRCCRHYSELPPYYQAWGYPNRYYRHKDWHWRHHGHIRRGHW